MAAIAGICAVTLMATCVVLSRGTVYTGLLEVQNERLPFARMEMLVNSPAWKDEQINTQMLSEEKKAVGHKLAAEMKKVWHAKDKADKVADEKKFGKVREDLSVFVSPSMFPLYLRYTRTSPFALSLSLSSPSPLARFSPRRFSLRLLLSHTLVPLASLITWHLAALPYARSYTDGLVCFCAAQGAFREHPRCHAEGAGPAPAPRGAAPLLKSRSFNSSLTVLNSSLLLFLITNPVCSSILCTLNQLRNQTSHVTLSSPADLEPRHARRRPALWQGLPGPSLSSSSSSFSSHEINC